MLTTNLTGAIRTALQDEYEVQVARRRGMRKWSLPTKWRPEVGRLADFLMDRGVNSVSAAREFIAAQFNFLSKRFCTDVFKLTYPPLPVFYTYHSRLRHNKTQLVRESFKLTTDNEKIKKTLVSELASIAGTELDRPRLQFALCSGVIGYHTLAYLSLSDKITSDLAGAVIRLHTAVDGDAESKFIDALRVVKKIGAGE